MNLVYARTFKMWVASDKNRMEQPVDFLKEQFDQMLAMPVPGQASAPSKNKTDYLADYRALMGKD